MSFFGELKRRNVIRMGAAYVLAAWLLIQVAETIFPQFGFGDGDFEGRHFSGIRAFIVIRDGPPGRGGLRPSGSGGPSRFQGDS
jgi:hypothetical protein